MPAAVVKRNMSPTSCLRMYAIQAVASVSDLEHYLRFVYWHVGSVAPCGSQGCN